ncbi:MAG: agmatine deiminase family protein [Bacteroides sp.]|uniref:agmatine deiminase family protein n=1 Tax=Bacteroides sp. TaxID=29523 RepID=UPI002FCA3655
MVLSELHKNKVYFSNLLALSYPSIWKEIGAVLTKYNYSSGKLTYTKDYWCRDFMPIQTGMSKFVQFRYEPDYLDDLRKYKTNPHDAVKHIVDFTPKVEKSKLIIDGGNIVVCNNSKGDTWVVMTDKVFKENPDHSVDEIISMLETELGAKIVWLPWDKNDECGHADGIVNFIDGSSAKPSVMAYYSLYSKEIADEMRKRLSSVFDVHELAFTTNEQNNWAYVNLLRTKDFIIVPGLGTESDKEAMMQIEQLYPNYKGCIHQINIAPIVEEYGGAFNCLSWTVQESDILHDNN